MDRCPFSPCLNPHCCGKLGVVSDGQLPIFTVLFTDIEGSTRMWEEHPDGMHVALTRHDEILRLAIEGNGGYVFRTKGDSFCATFGRAGDALSAVLVAQQQLGSEPWPDPVVIRVRMGLHSGPCIERDGDFFGPVVNRTARLESSAHGGQVVVSEATIDLLDDDQRDRMEVRDLGLHRLKDLGRPEHVFQLLIPGQSEEFPPLNSLGNPDLPNNLPEQVTTFIGREKELDDIRELIDRTRMVSLVGSGGAGKTRLALQVAAELLDGSGGGVWLVELASTTDPDLVLSSILSALGLREKPGRPLFDTLVDVIGNRRILLVLDNCEQVIGAVAHVVDRLLRSCPQMHMLMTSREPLAIDGEWVYRVPSLAVPSADDPEAAMQFDAVQLFVDRALQQQGGFLADAESLPTVIDICRRLDGIPLAIELAAVRLRSMSLPELLTRLDDRFRLLTGGSRTAPKRQQTLRAAVDWSYELLDGREAHVLCLLSVFAGGFTVESAESVCADDTMQSFEFLNILASLADKSLVRADIGASTRYHLNETIRQYAQERLAERGVAAVLAAREAHARVHLAMVERVAPLLIGGDQREWLDHLETEKENLRLAVAYWLEHWPSEDWALRSCIGLRRFWWARGYWAEGSELLTAALGSAGAQVSKRLRAEGLCAAGQMCARRSDHVTAQRHYRQGLELGRRLRDDEVIAECLSGLAWSAFSLGDQQAALPVIDESLLHARKAGNAQLLGLILERRASINYHDRDACRENYAEALSCLKSVQDLLSIGVVENNLADLELILGNTEGARSHLQSAVAICQELGDESVVYNYMNLGHVEYLSGNIDRARASYADALRGSRRTGDQFLVALAILGLAICLSAHGEDERAAELHGVSEGLLKDLGAVLDVLEVRLRQEDRQRLRHRMGDAAFDACQDRWRDHPEIDGIELAVASVKLVAPSTIGRPPTP
jgi:predicted ATPase/class 3 adenylate cyclase